MYRSALVLLSIVAICTQGSVIMPRIPALDGRIVGGEDTTIQNFPYQVSVRLFGSHTCGGSILNSRAVVTAAHCIYNFLGASSYSVQYGVTVVGGRKNVISAQRIIKNENYDSSVIDNDVALIFLTSDIPFSASAQPIELASEAPAPGTLAVVSGWGTLVEGGTASSVLQKVDVEIVNKKVCEEQYRGVNEITAKMLCAGTVGGGKDACQGDSGGPLVTNNQLAGIVSWGVGCARPEFSGVYTNVAALKNWIVDNLSKWKF